jgi:hypothetical protein
MMANPVHGIPDVCLGCGEVVGIVVTITSSSTTTTSSSEVVMFIDRRREWLESGRSKQGTISNSVKSLSRVTYHT